MTENEREMKYFVVRSKRDAKACQVDDYPSALEDFELPATGVRMGDAYPKRLRIKMSPETKGIVPPDLIPNTLGYLMVSEAAKALIEEKAEGAEIEFLPFSLINHRGRKTADTHYIVNVIGTSDCVDMEETDGSPGTFNEDEFSFIYSLRLDSELIDVEKNLFRLRPLPEMIVVREDLRDAIEEAGLTGFRFVGEGEDLQ